MRRKIAENLAELVDRYGTAHEAHEFRALLAVARAVGRAKAVAFDGPWQERIERAFAAHDRLLRSSRPQRAGRGR